MSSERNERVHALIQEGRHFVLGEYAERDRILARIGQVFLEGIERLESRTCRERVEAAGLSRVHLHFPVEKVLLLEHHLRRELAEELYDWSFRVGRDDLDLHDEFFVDNLIMFRIHYPFVEARRATNVTDPGFGVPEKLRAALADLRSLHMIRNRIGDLWNKHVADWLGFIDPETRYDAPGYYHKGLPAPARSHGPHIDTWYGHSYDGINLWLSVAGVNPDNTVILYPELFGHPIAYDPRSMYIAAGVPLPKPQKVDMAPGELLLFNPEIMHGTQVNISPETRFAVTTRINPGQPRFDPKADFHFQHWHSSRDLEAGRRRRLTVFPKTKYRGQPTVPDSRSSWLTRSARLHSAERLEAHRPVAICRSSDVAVGEKLAVDLANARILVVRTESGLRAVSRICPHMGIDLIDGHHDATQAFCPGHGVAYSLADGTSGCEIFRLKTYHVTDTDEMVVVERRDDTAE